MPVVTQLTVFDSLEDYQVSQSAKQQTLYESIEESTVIWPIPPPPGTDNIRDFQIFREVIIIPLPFTVSSEPHDFDQQIPWNPYYQGIANMDGSENVFLVKKKNQFIVSFVST